MALLHRASIVPTKPDLLAEWVPRQPWAEGSGGLAILGAFRLDDPAGAVGIEVFLVRLGDGPVLQIPVTYRGAPLPGGVLITEMSHTTLGPRWVYDGASDPVLLAVLAAVIGSHGTQAELLLQDPDGTTTIREPVTFARGTGDTLVGSWPGSDGEHLLARLAPGDSSDAPADVLRIVARDPGS